ncbi:class I SAM-dependent methyltransferase [Microbispora hainanensis]|uniref:class I SAM-dependent methyltransferase n=1 Tax=Microbispora hainanensis TaxID=568844 RepID=UPI001ABFF6AE|nr:class I SAM-dependent methyltransferase [Microbispora hainanensis]
MELWRTQDVLRRALPSPPARVLDVGGGTGVHAEWLVADGYEVELLDPVPLHVERARALPGVTARLGDARDLPLPDASADAVLLLGPLYHLPGRADRIAALAEARRVVRLEGAFWLYGDVDDWLDAPERRRLMLDAQRTLERVPSLLGVSGHLLTLARRPA